MRKRIVELKIDDLDMLSGVDQISLVDEPAIEYNWLAFKKHDHDFHVPEGEDDKFLSFLKDKGETHEDLEKEGWVVTKTEMIGAQEFNAKDVSDYDVEGEVRIRYRYGLSPNISGPTEIPTTRQWCRSLLRSNRVYRYEDLIDGLESNPLNPGGNAIFYRGGFNCRHYWYKLVYKPEGRIIDKASISKNRVADSSAYGDADLPQLSTITSKTANNPKPSTIRNLGLSKEKFALPLFEKEQDAIDYSKLIDCKSGAHPHDVNGTVMWMPCEAHPEDMEINVSGLPPYVDQVPECDECEKKKKKVFSTDVEKREIVGPAMISNVEIFRRDEKGNPYYVYFSEETIKQIAEKFMRKGYTVDGQHDVEHRGPGEKDVFVTESWIIEDPENDKSRMYGFYDLPKGTWMVKMKVLNNGVWKEIKEGKLNGFSVSGFFEEYEVESRSTEFLKELAKILRK